MQNCLTYSEENSLQIAIVEELGGENLLMRWKKTRNPGQNEALYSKSVALELIREVILVVNQFHQGFFELAINLCSQKCITRLHPEVCIHFSI